MMPQDCDGCSKCGTTLAQSPHDHQPIKPHPVDRLIRKFDQNTGEPYTLCGVCFRQIPSDEGGVEAT